MNLKYILYVTFLSTLLLYPSDIVYAAESLNYESCKKDIVKATTLKSRKLICASYLKGYEDGTKLVPKDDVIGGTFDVTSSTQVFGVLSGISGNSGAYGPDDLMTVRLPSNWQDVKQNGDTSWALIAGNKSALGTKIKQKITIPADSGEPLADAVIPEFKPVEEWVKNMEDPEQFVKNLESFASTLPADDNGYVLTLRDSKPITPD